MHSKATHFPLRMALAASHGFDYSVLSFLLGSKHSGVLLSSPVARTSVMSGHGFFSLDPYLKGFVPAEL